MDSVYSQIEAIFVQVIQYCILFVELVGVAVLLYTIVRAIYQLFTHRQRVRLDLAEGIALSLQFKMGSELLRTLIAREWNELMILGAVILLRAALTFLIQWEIRNEQKKELAAREQLDEKAGIT